MTARVTDNKAALPLALLLALMTMGGAPVALAEEDHAVFACVEIRDFQARRSEVEAVPGLAELVRSALGDLSDREAVLLRRGAQSADLSLAKLSGEEDAAPACGLDESSWDPRLGHAPLVRGVVDLAQVRAMLLDRAAEEPLPLRAMALELVAAKLAPFSTASFSRDIRGDELQFVALLRYEGAPAAVPALSKVGKPFTLGGEGLGWSQLPALTRLLGALEGLEIDVRAEEEGLILSGRALFASTKSDRP